LMIGFSVLSSGMFMVKMVEETHLEALRASMLRELRIIQTTTEWADLHEKAVQLMDMNDTRITFIDASGTVLGDSEHDPETMDNHLNREEISEASKSKVVMGYSIRYSETLKRDMLYAAIPVYEADTQLGFIRIAMSLEAIDTI